MQQHADVDGDLAASIVFRLASAGHSTCTTHRWFSGPAGHGQAALEPTTFITQWQNSVPTACMQDATALNHVYLPKHQVSLLVEALGQLGASASSSTPSHFHLREAAIARAIKCTPPEAMLCCLTAAAPAALEHIQVSCIEQGHSVAVHPQYPL